MLLVVSSVIGFNGIGVRVLNEYHAGHITKETDDKIVIFGSFGYRFDVPKSKIKEVGS